MKLKTLTCLIGLFVLTPLAFGQKELEIGQPRGITQPAPQSQKEFLKIVNHFRPRINDSAVNEAHIDRDRQLSRLLRPGAIYFPELGGISPEEHYQLIVSDLASLYPGSAILSLLSNSGDFQHKLDLWRGIFAGGTEEYVSSVIDEIDLVEEHLSYPCYFVDWKAKVMEANYGKYRFEISLGSGAWAAGVGPSVVLECRRSDYFAIAPEDSEKRGNYKIPNDLVLGEELLLTGRFRFTPSGLLASPSDIEWKSVLEFQRDRIGVAALISPNLAISASRKTVRVSKDLLQVEGNKSLEKPIFFIDLLEIKRSGMLSADYSGLRTLGAAGKGSEIGDQLLQNITSFRVLFDKARKILRTRAKSVEEIRRNLRSMEREIGQVGRSLYAKIETWERSLVRVKSQYVCKKKHERFNKQLDRTQYYGTPEKKLKAWHKSLERSLSLPDFGSVFLKSVQALQLTDVLAHRIVILQTYIVWYENWLECLASIPVSTDKGKQNKIERLQKEIWVLEDQGRDLYRAINTANRRGIRSFRDLVKSFGDGK